MQEEVYFKDVKRRPKEVSTAFSIGVVTLLLDDGEWSGKGDVGA